jgi:hypothetical protein
MKPEQLEIAQLKREAAKLKAERDILKKQRPTSRSSRREVRLRREAPKAVFRGHLRDDEVIWRVFGFCFNR